jgi:hypothetical protein
MGVHEVGMHSMICAAWVRTVSCMSGIREDLRSVGIRVTVPQDFNGPLSYC